jgi:signal transduction histidine kinase
MKYILADKSGGCIFCQKSAEADDARNYILLRDRTCFALLNLYPYSNGHLMVAPYKHVADLGDLTDVQLSKLGGMARKGRYLLGLVNEYLDLARVESGELRLDPTSRVNVNEQVIGEALALVAPQLEAHQVQLVTELPHAPLPLICCDATLLRIVLVNLLDNAVKYGNEDGTIRLKAEVTPARQDSPAKLKISVWNLGPGFSQAEKDKLFRRFSRLDDPALKGRRGTGVGLYSAWRIIQLHKGRISADSKHGEWAEFSFEIPAEPDCTGLLPTGQGSDA